MISIRPLWARVVLLVSIVVVVTAASLFAYRYYKRPVTLTVAVGSTDGEAAKVMAVLASRFTEIGAPVRLKIIDTSTALEAAKRFAAGDVDLAVVRSDVGDLSQAQTVAIMAYLVALLIAPPGSAIDSIDKLKGRTVGVLAPEANSRIVEVLTREYDLGRAKVVFRNVAPADAKQAIQSKTVDALLVVIPLTGKYLSVVRGFFPQGPKMPPVMIPIDAAEAIAGTERAYESFDVPKGTLRGSPAVPDDDLTTLRTAVYLVANKKLDTRLISSLVETLMTARRDLLAEQPLLAQITASSTDPNSFLPAHSGAAAFYNGTVESYLDQYGDAIYLVPMLLGAIASVLAASWKFLGIGKPETIAGPLDTLYALARQIRAVDTEAELSNIEEKIDEILNAQRALAASGNEDAVDAATLNVVAHRLENLIHDRRITISTRPGANANPRMST